MPFNLLHNEFPFLSMLIFTSDYNDFRLRQDSGYGSDMFAPDADFDQ